MASAEEEMNKLAYEAQYLQAQGEEIGRQVQNALMLKNEIENTIKTIESMKTLKDETYFQIGAGSFVKARASEERGVLVDVGAAIFVEKKPDEAKELLEKRLQNLEKAVEILKKNAEQITKRLQEIDSRASELQGQ
jgi:prefoldin alpha subunit